MQALTIIQINITPNVQVDLDCFSAKTAWDSLVSQYAQTNHIVQNLTHTHLHAKQFIERST